MAKLTEKVVREIAEKRQRGTQPDTEASWRSSSLLQTFHDPAKHTDELLRYFPIAVVSMIEGYFRSRLAELISSGDPFLSNSLRNYSEINLDIPLAGAITRKDVSIGELITHSNAMSIGSFGALIKIVRDVTGRQNPLEELAKVESASLGGRKSKPVMSDPASTWRHLGKVFEVRHILCHELAANIVLDKNETRNLLLAAQDFVKASAIWFDNLQNPNRPTFEQRYASAEARRDSALARLHSLLSALKAMPKVELVSDDLRDGLNGASRDVERLLSSLSNLLSISARPEHERSRMFEEYERNLFMSPVIEQLTAALEQIGREIREKVEVESKYHKMHIELKKKKQSKRASS